ncbi:MAG: hypothetical protein MUF54_18680 [Polyangiaceae bacterium]|jgi:hypothetical protein|nr:hypothetical protein [Polyangiaceae bacterium]
MLITRPARMPCHGRGHVDVTVTGLGPHADGMRESQRFLHPHKAHHAPYPNMKDLRNEVVALQPRRSDSARIVGANEINAAVMCVAMNLEESRSQHENVT